MNTEIQISSVKFFEFIITVKFLKIQTILNRSEHMTEWSNCNRKWIKCNGRLQFKRQGLQIIFGFEIKSRIHLKKISWTEHRRNILNFLKIKIKSDQ